MLPRPILSYRLAGTECGVEKRVPVALVNQLLGAASSTPVPGPGHTNYNV